MERHINPREVEYQWDIRYDKKGAKAWAEAAATARAYLPPVLARELEIADLSRTDIPETYSSRVLSAVARAANLACPNIEDEHDIMHAPRGLRVEVHNVWSAVDLWWQTERHDLILRLDGRPESIILRGPAGSGRFEAVQRVLGRAPHVTPLIQLDAPFAVRLGEHLDVYGIGSLDDLRTSVRRWSRDQARAAAADLVDAVIYHDSGPRAGDARLVTDGSLWTRGDDGDVVHPQLGHHAPAGYRLARPGDGFPGADQP